MHIYTKRILKYKNVVSIRDRVFDKITHVDNYLLTCDLNYPHVIHKLWIK
ncbi:conserved hypothetical protein [Bacillus mycoides]|uniref:Uncharacterized protein n=1 Tax=Bacillus mycoides TaxID=1405 RepID=A0A653UI52_BACMY|nr:conserved hypothetical protein [Bacillus mycoides]